MMMCATSLASYAWALVAAAAPSLGPPPPEPVAQMPAGKSLVTKSGVLDVSIEPIVLGDLTNRVQSVVVDPTGDRIVIVQTRKLTWVSAAGEATTHDLPAVPGQFSNDAATRLTVDEKNNRLRLVRVASSQDLNQSVIDVIDAGTGQLLNRHIVESWLSVRAIELVRDPVRGAVSIAATRREFQLCLFALDGTLLWSSDAAKGAFTLLGVMKGPKPGEDLLVTSQHQRSRVALSVLDSTGAEQFNRKLAVSADLRRNTEDATLGSLPVSRLSDSMEILLKEGKERSRLTLRLVDTKIEATVLPFTSAPDGAELVLSQNPIRKARVSARSAIPIIVQGQQNAGHPDPQVMLCASTGVPADDTVAYLQLPPVSGAGGARIGRTEKMNWLLLWADGSAFRVSVKGR